MRIRVSLSRSWTLGASSFASLTRVCNAIRSALELELGIAPLRDSIIPEFDRPQSKLVFLGKPFAPSFAANLALNSQIQKTLAAVKSFQSFELLVRGFEFRIAVMDDFRRSALERLLGRDAVQPALLGKLFVRGKIQAYEKTDFSIGGCGVFSRRWRAGFGGSGLALGLFRGFSFEFLGQSRRGSRFGLGSGLGSCALGTVHLVLQLFVKAEGLPPAIQLVPRLLRLFLVGAKIKSNITMSHESSLRRTTP